MSQLAVADPVKWICDFMPSLTEFGPLKALRDTGVIYSRFESVSLQSEGETRP